MLVILKDEVKLEVKEPEDIETYEIKINLGIYKRQRLVLNLLYLAIVSIWSLGKKEGKSGGPVGGSYKIGLRRSIFWYFWRQNALVSFFTLG